MGMTFESFRESRTGTLHKSAICQGRGVTAAHASRRCGHSVSHIPTGHRTCRLFTHVPHPPLATTQPDPSSLPCLSRTCVRSGLPLSLLLYWPGQAMALPYQPLKRSNAIREEASSASDIVTTPTSPATRTTPTSIGIVITADTIQSGAHASPTGIPVTPVYDLTTGIPGPITTPAPVVPATRTRSVVIRPPSALSPVKSLFLRTV
ncbi:hypothetical protein C8Q74DRAFT_953972 [Fomes fomentarius]|nr:hypothetical protein C8Q74DRAFT_953972 [Fomes fomentarius]